MTKRSGKGAFQQFPRNGRDFYPTPPAALVPLRRHLPQDGEYRYCEPCAGDGAIVNALDTCVYACDLEPHMGLDIERRDCLTITADECDERVIEAFVTNPPWPHPSKGGEPTTSIIRHLMLLRPSWFLLPADMMHNRYMAPLLGHCERIVSVGRVKWIADSKMTGTDNCVWMLFQPYPVSTTFYGR